MRNAILGLALIIHLKLTIIFCLLYQDQLKLLAGWLEIILREISVLKYIKTLIKPHIEVCTQVWTSLLRNGNWNLILKLKSIQRRVTKYLRM